MEGLKTAIHYGADAIYMGGEAFSLRANAKNFSLEKMKEAVDYAHERGVRSMSPPIFWPIMRIYCLCESIFPN